MPGKCKDLIMDIATEEMGHDEMIATIVCQAAGRSTGHRRHQGCGCRSGGRRGARRDESAAGHRRQGRRAAAQVGSDAVNASQLSG
jgi:Mn-containing catalase